MQNWFYKNLGDAMLADDSLQQIKQLFLQAYPDPAQQSDKAILYYHLSEGRLHCEVMVYFSPGCSSLAQALAADPCQKPSSSGLSLLIGDVRTLPHFND